MQTFVPDISRTSDRAARSPRLYQKAIPWLLLSVRVVLTPFIIVASNALTDRTLFWLYILAFVTDYFDGVAARYFGTATPLLRKADTTADTLFHIALAYVIFQRHPEEFHRNTTAIPFYLVSLAIWCALDAARWHRLAGFHAYSSKLFSIALLVWMVMLLNGWNTEHLFSMVLVLGVASNAEGIIISLILRQDRVDVPTLFHALRLRQDIPN